MTVQFPQGNVFVADSGNSLIQQFTTIVVNSLRYIVFGENTGDITNIDLDVDSDGKIYSYGLWPRCYKVISP